MSAFAHPLLDLTDEEALALPAAELAALEQAALREFATTRRFTKTQWNVLVESWNDAMPNERQARHAYCVRARKHDWVELPMAGCFVCRRCVAYKCEGEK